MNGEEGRFICDSVICQVFSRCGLSFYYNDEDLEHRIKSISNDEIFAAAGGYIQELSKNILLEINRAVKEYEKNIHDFDVYRKKVLEQKKCLEDTLRTVFD